MEGRASITDGKRIMGVNFIGPDELSLIAGSMKIQIPENIPAIPYTRAELISKKDDYILILGLSGLKNGEPLTLNSLREIFGIDPSISEPCFYNQDWYLNEDFACTSALSDGWFLLKKVIINESRGLSSEAFATNISHNLNLPGAVLCAFTFFSFYLLSRGKKLWEEDYIWCSDHDHNGDQIYVGRYVDPSGINKNGFSIHRHLSIKENYGCLEVL